MVINKRNRARNGLFDLFNDKSATLILILFISNTFLSELVRRWGGIIKKLGENYPTKSLLGGNIKTMIVIYIIIYLTNR